MTHRFQIVEAKAYHCGQIVRMLRREHHNAMTILGQKAHHELRTCFDGSAFKKAWLIDGKLAGLGGVLGTSISSAGYIWLALSETATKFPVAIVKEAIAQLKEISTIKRKLVTTIIPDDKASYRFAQHMGFYVRHPLPFDEGEKIRMEMSVGFKQKLVRRKNAEPSPFIVYTAGRSRTAWLSAFLTYGESRCHNEVAVKFREMNEVQGFFGRGNTGSAETAAAPGWKLINHFVPNIKTVVVLRDIEDIISSFARMEISKIATVDEDRLRKVVLYEDRCLRAIAAQPGVLTVNFSDLTRAAVCKVVFEHCLPYEFDLEWWEELNRKNIQSNVFDLVQYYQQHKDEVEEFKNHCKRQMITLVRSGVLKSESGVVNAIH